MFYLLTLLSAILLTSFIYLGVAKYGQLASYSAYAAKWESNIPLTSTTHLWSIVTFIAALLIIPAMVELGEGNPAQCLGFLTPVYLIIVSRTPEWETNTVQHRIHMLFAILCALGNILWVCLVCKLWWLLLIVAFAFSCFAYNKGSLWSCKVFWGEMIMFASAYLSILISL